VCVLIPKGHQKWKYVTELRDLDVVFVRTVRKLLADWSVIWLLG
jgi:hypothetical protein